MISTLKTALYSILAAAFAVVARRIIQTRRMPFYVILFFVLPVGQLFLLYSFSLEAWSVFWLIGLLLGLIANFLVLIYAISQEKKTEAEEELKKTRRLSTPDLNHVRAALTHRSGVLDDIIQHESDRK